jgi:hypothetical protein
MTLLKKINVFLCHSSHDKTVVRELYGRLVSKNWINPWLDEEKLLPGQNWDLEIEKAVKESHVVIIFCSEDSVNREGYAQRELKYVLDLALEKEEDTIFIIPLRLGDCEIPRRLKSWQYADYFPESQKEKAFQKLLMSLGVRANLLGINTINTQSLDPLTPALSLLTSKSFPVPSLRSEEPFFIDSSGNIIYLPKMQEFIIGRLDEERKIVPDFDIGRWDDMRTVSRRHAKMIFHNGRYHLQAPFNSLNGTFINEVKVGGQMQEVKNGDKVRFAGVVFEFRFLPHIFT